MKMKMTNTPPSKRGYYWFYDGMEHTPTIVYASLERRVWWAVNEELCFAIHKDKKVFWSARIPDPEITPAIRKAVEYEDMET